MTKITAVPVNSATPLAPSRQRPLVSLREEIDRFWNEFDSGLRLPNHFTAPAYPAMDVAETDKSFELTAELPGYTEKDVKIELINGDLRIRGEKNENREERQKDFYLSERRHGAFERRLRLPDGIDPARIEATFENGLLAITLPKTAEAQKPAKEIQIKSSS